MVENFAEKNHKLESALACFLTEDNALLMSCINSQQKLLNDLTFTPDFHDILLWKLCDRMSAKEVL